ncbi:hypothetical protein WJX81_000525 [Elliptochloris bilobata]|uniref:Oxidoreductase n=1 Tax=Elliptochloris bilobata TaxID=381761 RepID=A0AAW1QGP7_9CHLO
MAASHDALRPKRAIVVTGASTGIGYGISNVLLQKGYCVFGSVRRQKDAERLQAELGPAFMPLVFDVTDEPAVKAAASKVRAALAGSTLFGLVNNAGMLAHGPVLLQPISEFRQMLEVNLIGVIVVTQAFLPLLGADRALRGEPGRIVMISSVAGKMAAPFLAGYVASKQGLEGFSTSLRRELMIYGIDVIVIGPGAVTSAIWDKAEAVDMTRYDNSEYGVPLRKFGRSIIKDGRTTNHTPEYIGGYVLKALTTQAPAARCAVVYKRFQNWTLPLSLPPRWLDQLMAMALQLKRPPAAAAQK